ncbi:MAG TPA: carbohydrate ABC transporter permease [Candidatus Methylacidiphilales bacterium]
MKLAARLSLLAAYAVLGLAALLTLAPMLWLVCSAFKTPDDFFSSLFLPAGNGFLGVAWDRLSADNLRRLFAGLHFGGALANSLLYASVTSLLGALFCAMGGYALAKFEFPGKKLCLGIVLTALVIPAPLLLAPGYEWLWKLGLLNTYSGLILPGMAGAFGVFLFRQSLLNTLPTELLEAARIDGCGEARIFFTIVLPLVRPTLGAFVLITFLGAWNNFIGPQVVLQSPEKYPLAVAIAQLKGTYSQDYGMLMSGTLVSVLPVVALFLFLQKEFIDGLAAGAVKG